MCKLEFGSVADFTIIILLIIHAIIFKNQARALNKSVEDSKAKEELELRAYVLPEKGWIDGCEDLNEMIFGTGVKKAFPKITYHVSFNNSGRTPAYDVSSQIAFGFGPLPKKNQVIRLTENSPGREINDIQSRSPIGSGGTTKKTLDLVNKIPENDLNNLRSGTTALYIFGNISYMDVFERRWVFNYSFIQKKIENENRMSTELTISPDNRESRVT